MFKICQVNEKILNRRKAAELPIIDGDKITCESSIQRKSKENRDED